MKLIHSTEISVHAGAGDFVYWYGKYRDGSGYFFVIGRQSTVNSWATITLQTRRPFIKFRRNLVRNGC